MSAARRRVDALVLVRDRNACAACGGPIRGERGRDHHIHHRRPRSLGGSSLAWVNLPANLVLLHASCHGLIESQRDIWRDRGFLVSANGVLRADEVPIMHRLLGLCLLDDLGGHTPVEGEGWAY